MASVEYDKMFVKDLRRVLQERPVAYLPLGAPEMHGEHLTFGQDGIKAHEICKRIAEAGGGAVLPALHAGTAVPTAFNFGNIYISAPVTRARYREFLEGLARGGCRVGGARTGHYPSCQVAMTKHAAADAMETTGAWTVGLDECELSFDLGYRGDHAGKWETSVYWHLRPDLVQMENLPEDLNVRLIAAGPEDPRVHASPELGEQVVATVVERMNGFVDMLLEFDRDPVTHGPTKTTLVSAMRAMAVAHWRGEPVVRRTEEYWQACEHFYAGEFQQAQQLIRQAWAISPAELAGDAG